MSELVWYILAGFGILTLGAFLGAAVIEYELSKDKEEDKWLW